MVKLANREFLIAGPESVISLHDPFHAFQIDSDGDKIWHRPIETPCRE